MKWWSIRRRDADLERELQSDLELEMEEQREAGVSPEEAGIAAKRAFGNLTLIAEQTHETWGWGPFERLGQDIRHALRRLRKSPGFTVTTVLILALGIGAVTAVFSLIDTALLKMLPVRDPERLVELKAINPAFDVNDAFSYTAFQAFDKQARVLDGALAFRTLGHLDVEVNGRGGLAEGQLVSGDYFSVLGVGAILGRTILPIDESAAGQNPVAVIGYDCWRSRFGLDPSIVGRSILINNAPFTIIGVTGPEFYGLEPGAKIDISVPLTMVAAVSPGWAAAGTPADALKAPFRNWLHVIGRLHPGVSRDQAQSSLAPVFAQSMREAADGLAGSPIDSAAVRQAFLERRLQLESGSQGLASLRRQFSKPLWIVMAIVGLLLLITCANIANLLLARSQARERELAVRLALGAGKSRLIRQLLTESLVLGLAGGALGVVVAYGGSRSLLALMARGRNPVSLTVHPDLMLLAFALGVSLLTAMVFGILPAFRAAEVIPSRGLIQQSRTQAPTTARYRLGRTLVVLQVAISLVLVIGAGLLARTLANLRSFYPGFNRENVLLFSLNPPMIGENDVVPLYERVLSRLRVMPGVRSASLSVHEPLSTNVSTTAVRVLGPASHEGEDLAPVNIEPVGPDYFATLEVPLLQGRDFSSDDRSGTRKVAIVNETTAHHYFGEANPIGRFVSIPGFVGDSSWIEIVGEVPDIKVHDLREPATAMLYLPLFQLPEGGATFEIRTVIDPGDLEAATLKVVGDIDRRLPVYSVKTLDSQLDDAVVQERLVASISVLFGLIALLLTSVGLYGLLAYTASRRTGEIGIRMALGAERARIVRMILGETILMVLCGLGIGLPAAALSARLIATQLFRLKPGDPITFSTASLLMAVVALAASYWPAHRAASIDPMRALRSD